MDEFNDLLSKNELTEGQLNVCRDIRRRGKNKVAAQNCRQRKLEQIEELQQQLGRAMERRDKMKHEHNRLYNVYNLEAEKLRHITECVLKHFNKDVANYSLQVKYKKCSQGKREVWIEHIHSRHILVNLELSLFLIQKVSSPASSCKLLITKPL